MTRESFLKEYIFQGNHIQFNFSALATFKARLKEMLGNYPANTTSTPGLLLGLKYQANLNNQYSIIGGPEANVVGRDFIVSFHANDFTPSLVKSYRFSLKDTYIPDLIISFPLLVEKRVFYADSKYIFFNAGVRFNISTSADFDELLISVMNTNNNLFNVAYVDVVANNKAKPWISFPLNSGHAWLLKNNNLLQLAVTSNISFTKYVNGTYSISIPNKPITEGKYSSTGSYIGLSFNYVFTSANFRIRKAYEQKEGLKL